MSLETSVMYMLSHMHNILENKPKTYIEFKLHVADDNAVRRYSVLDIVARSKPPIPLDGDSATIRFFGQNDTNRSRNGAEAERRSRAQ